MCATWLILMAAAWCYDLNSPVIEKRTMAKGIAFIAIHLK